MPIKGKAQKRRVVCWDACVFIRLIERRPESIEILDILHRQALEKKLYVVTSSLVMGEVFQWNIESDLDRAAQIIKVQDFFENPWIKRQVADMELFKRVGEIRGESTTKLELPDAVYLATALKSEVEELHTYDKDLLRCDGKFWFDRERTKGPLKICHPNVPEERLPLFDR